MPSRCTGSSTKSPLMPHSRVDWGDCSKETGKLTLVPAAVEASDRSFPRRGPLVPFHIEGDASPEIAPATHTVDRFLHLAVTSITPLNRIRRRREELVIKEGQGLLEV